MGCVMIFFSITSSFRFAPQAGEVSVSEGESDSDGGVFFQVLEDGFRKGAFFFLDGIGQFWKEDSRILYRSIPAIPLWICKRRHAVGVSSPSANAGQGLGLEPQDSVPSLLKGKEEGKRKGSWA